MQRDAARDIHAVDRQHPEIEAARLHRPFHAALPVEAEIEHEALERQHAGPPLAAHQRAEVELHVQLVGTDLGGIVVAADGDLAQPQRRRRQQQRIKLAADPHRRADDARRFRLELRAELVPVNEIRTNQRCNQRKNKSNGQSEQRGLQGLSSTRGDALRHDR